MEGQVEDIEIETIMTSKRNRVSLIQARMKNATNEKPTCIGRNSPWSGGPNGHIQIREFL
jgi:hypothetical protein